MTLGEYEQRAVYKRYNIVGNDPDSVLETFPVVLLDLIWILWIDYVD